MKTHKFHEDLKRGKLGEDLFHKANPHLTRLDGFKSDFIDEATGQTYELKTDFYDMDKTNNFFLEVLSNADKGKVGGALQAALNNTTFYVYMFILNKVTFTFKVNDLILWLEKYILEQRPPVIMIQNKGYVTTGHKIARELLKHLYVEERLK